MVTYKSNVALIEADRKRESARYTYLEMRQESLRVTSLLQERGFSADDRCAVLMSNQSKWLISATGALWAGATLVPLDYKLTAPEQLALLKHCQPKVLVTEYPVWRKLRSLELDQIPNTEIFVTDVPDSEDLTGATRWEADTEYVATEIDRGRDDIACIVYSSGTGGTPKGCQLTHHNYLAQAQILGRLYPMTEDDRYFSILPTNHAIDFMCGFLVPLIMGGAVVHQRTLRPQFLGPTMKKYGISHMALVPMLLKTLEKRIRDALDELPSLQRQLIDTLISVNDFATKKSPNHALSSRILKPLHARFGGRLRYIFCGGAFVDRGPAEFFYSIGIPVAIGYGLTEAGTVLTVNDLKPFRGDTVGKPVPGTEIEIRDANDEGIGEVWARGPTVMKGYLEEPELTAESIVDGWLRTGDLGHFDAAGHLKLRGRAKNMIVTEGGKNIYPEDIEAAFDDLEACEEFAVFAANYIWPTGAMTGEQLTAVLRPADGNEIDAACLKDLRTRNGRLADYKRVTSYLVWPKEFPRTASLKVKRLALAQELRDALNRDALEELAA
jgi:long-chain acyl-CoA synthetase